MDNLDHLIANLLNISSSDIESILSTVDNGTTNIFITLKKSVHHCPFCNSPKLRSKGFFSKHLLFLTFLLKMLSFISAFADFIV